MLNVTRFGHPKIMVPAIHLLVDVHETQPYTFPRDSFGSPEPGTGPVGRGLRHRGGARHIFVERRRAEEFNTIVSNPSDNRPRFLPGPRATSRDPHRFLSSSKAPAFLIAVGPARTVSSQWLDRLSRFHYRAIRDSDRAGRGREDAERESQTWPPSITPTTSPNKQASADASRRTMPDRLLKSPSAWGCPSLSPAIDPSLGERHTP